MYFVQAYFLVTIDKSCFVKEIKAFDFGSVVLEVYDEYKMFVSSDIPNLPSFVDSINNICISDEDKERINAVINLFADWSATDLLTIIHKQTP